MHLTVLMKKWSAAEDNPNVTIHHYYDFLAKLMDDHITIGIAGTHGKTSTTGMAYHLFKDYDKTNVLIGDGTGYATKGAKYFVAECANIKIISYGTIQIMLISTTLKWTM